MSLRNILIIAFNQIRTQMSERGALIMTFLVPLLMMTFIGIATGGMGGGTRTVDVIRPQDDPMADKFVALLRSDGAKLVNNSPQFVVCDLSSGEAQPESCALKEYTPESTPNTIGEARLKDSVVSGTIVLTERFGADLEAGLQTAISVRVRGNDPTSGQVISGYVGAVTARLGGAVTAARTVTKRANGDEDFFKAVYANAQALWDKDPVVVSETFTTINGVNAGTGFGQSAPGIGAMFVMINALVLVQVFIIERKNWTLQRLMTLPVSRAEILAGKLLGQYLIGVLTFAVMLIVGTLFGVQWGDWLGVVVVVLVYTLAVTAMALMLSTFIRTISQASGIGLLIPMVLAPLGGAWWPMDIVPQTMQTVGYIISPVAWSQRAFNQMVFYGATLVDILPAVGALLLFSVVFFGIGLIRFRLE